MESVIPQLVETIPQLVLKGVLDVAINKAMGVPNDPRVVLRAARATEAEVMRMSGVVAAIRDATADLRDTLSTLSEAIDADRVAARRDRLTAAMHAAAVPDALRGKTMDLAAALETVVADTSVETIALDVSRVVADEDDDAELYNSCNKEVFDSTCTTEQLVRKVLEMEANDGILTGVQHSTSCRMRLYVSAWAPSEKKLKNLAEATGALYQLCQIICDVLADPRGVSTMSEGEGFITRSFTKLADNATVIVLNYDWPTPTQLDNFSEIVRKAEAGQQDATHMLSQAIEQRALKQRTKNVYLIGQTGEGKSTLANAFTGTERFHVSYAGTGTYDVDGCLAQRGGKLDMNEQVMVWDTPGMNDQDGLDQMFENKLYAHLTREQTVSIIMIVSKDGSRFPRSLKDMIRVYKRAFGESFMSCVAVCIGITMETTSPEVLKQKRMLWKQNMRRALGQKLPPDRIYFYNATDESPQAETQRLVRMVSDAEIFLSGSGNTIYQGLLKLRVESDQLAKDETKTRMRKASDEIALGLTDEIMTNTKIRFKYQRSDQSVNVRLLHSLRTSVHTFFRTRQWGGKKNGNSGNASEEVPEKRRKEIRFCQGGARAKQLMRGVGLPMVGVPDKDRLNIMMQRARKQGLVFTKMESETESETNDRVQVQNYLILDIDHDLDGEIYRRIELILQGLVTDRHVAEPIMAELEKVAIADAAHR